MDPQSPEDRKKFAVIVKKYHRNANRQNFPWRREDASPYEVLLAEIFLQRTNRKQALRVFQDFISLFPSPESLADASAEKIKRAMTPLGLHWRAENVHKLGKILCDKFDGEVPSDEEIFELPGIGPYHGNMILFLAFGRRTCPVDANIARILNRVFGLGREKKAGRLSRNERIKDVAEKSMPEESCKEYLLGLLDIGDEFCKSNNPRCGECPLNRNCNWGK